MRPNSSAAWSSRSTAAEPSELALTRTFEAGGLVLADRVTSLEVFSAHAFEQALRLQHHRQVHHLAIELHGGTLRGFHGR